MPSSNAIPVIDLTGPPLARGQAYGEAMRDAIREFAEAVTSVHQVNNSHLRAPREQLLAFCMRFHGFLEEFAPESTTEMRGVAAGAGLPYEDILYLNAFLELEDLRAPGLGGKALPTPPGRAGSLWGCTTFNVTPRASADGRAYIGQNYDMEKFYERFLCILRVQPESGPAALTLTFAGVLGLCGLNAAGIGAVINKVAATDARPGVVYPCIMRKALAAERIGDALGAVIYSPRAAGINYQLTGEGVAFCAETSATDYALLRVGDAIAHTNHYLDPAMRAYETPHWLSHGGTMVRHQVAQAFLDDHAGGLTPALLQELARNHTNHPRSICAHGFPGEPEQTAFHTCFSVVMDPAAGWLDACAGNPCENEYQRYVL